MNYESQIQPLEAAGKSDAEIVAILKADPRHVRDIMATSSDPDTPDILGILVGRYQLLRLGVDATWKGPLVDYFSDQNVNPQLKFGFEMLLAQLQISNRRIWCNGVAAQGFLVSAMTQVSAGIVKAMGGDAAQLQTDMDELTGGLLYANLTEQDIADARTEYKLSLEPAKPVETDAQSHEVLLSANRQADGRLSVVVRVTPVGMFEDKVVSRGETQTLVNDAELTKAIATVIEGLIDG